MRTIIMIVGALLFHSCASTKKETSSYVEVIPNFPYRTFTKSKLNKNEPPLDTTFDYKVLERPIYTRLPKKIFGTKAKGTVEFYAIIDSSKHVADIQPIDCEFYGKGSIVYRYHENTNIEIDKILKEYIFKFMQEQPFVQNGLVTLALHPTYCFIYFK